MASTNNNTEQEGIQIPLTMKVEQEEGEEVVKQIIASSSSNNDETSVAAPTAPSTATTMKKDNDDVTVAINSELRGLIMGDRDQEEEIQEDEINDINIDKSENKGVIQRRKKGEGTVTPSSNLQNRSSHVTRFSNITPTSNHNNNYNIGIKDHYSLQHPSSHLSLFQNDDEEAIVFVDNLDQITFKKKQNQNYVTAMQNIAFASPGLILLRSIYTWIALMMVCVLGIFCIQTLLFLFIGAINSAGLHSDGFNFGRFCSTIPAFPVIIIGLSQIMVFGQTFVIDAWKGFTFLQTLTRWDSITIDWVLFSMCFGFPILIGSIGIFSSTGTSEEDDQIVWWTIMLLSWLCLFYLLFIVFVITAIFHEVKGCLHLVKKNPELRNMDDEDENETMIRTFSRLVILRLKQKLSGYESITYLVQGNETNPDMLTYNDVKKIDSIKSYVGPFSTLTKTKFMNRFYNVLEEPKRQHSVSDILDNSSFVTNTSWGLESVFCRNRSARFVAVTGGESALTDKQVGSSTWFFGVGLITIWLSLVGILVWVLRFILPGGFLALTILVPTVAFMTWLYKPYKYMCNVASKIVGTTPRTQMSFRQSRKNETLHHIRLTYRVTEPSTQELNWICVGFIAVVFFLSPVIAMFAVGNTPVGLIFLMLSAVTVLRDVCSFPACLRELGSLEERTVKEGHTRNRDEWREKHRLGKLMVETSLGKRHIFWIGFTIYLLLAFFGLFLLAMKSGDYEDDTPKKFANKTDFVYNGLDDALCSFPNNFKTPDGTATAMVDFAFMADLAYRNTAEDELKEWFGEKATELKSDVVKSFQRDYQKDNGETYLHYLLINFPQTNLTMVSVRGSSSKWDFMHDLQLYVHTGGLEIVRSTLPLGHLWTPALPYLIKMLSFVESKALKDVSYYKEITKFVELLKQNGHNIQIVGHSLGGGIAIVSGAQMQVPGVAISGPGAVLSRLTYGPQEVKKKDLDKYTFNIIPDKDPIPRVDDYSRHYRKIKCRQQPNDFKHTCHLIGISLCEILYTCGSVNRPIPCDCVNEFGFEKPKSINGAVFEDECPK